jgi:hypothetical protein
VGRKIEWRKGLPVNARNGMQLDQHQTLRHYYMKQSSHERTVDPPCARTRNRHDRTSTTCSQPQRATARSPRILAQNASRAAHQGSKWYPNLACMANHARGADVCNRVGQKVRRTSNCDCAATLLACSRVHTTGLTRCCLLTDDATPESGW